MTTNEPKLCLRCVGIPPKFSPLGQKVEVIGEPQRIDGGNVVRVRGQLWTGDTIVWKEPCCNLYNEDGTRFFGELP